nr:AAA family ATPase [Chitinophagaceae bacterium]
MDYFGKLGDLLKMERQEDRDQYKQLAERSSVNERRTNGISWYPIAIRGTEITRGDYLAVEAERTTHLDLPHQLRFGMPASLFSNHDPKENRLDGIITHLGGNRLKITLRVDELPDWADDGKLGIDLLFDDNSYEEMNNALKTAAALSEKENEGRLIKILTGEKSPSFQNNIIPVAAARLNSSQLEAVNKIVSANELAIVHGPPGTGKTTTLVQAIKAMIALDHQQMLVVAPSNTAVDLLSEKLADEGLNVL